jgi:hypothetical protein
MGWPPHRQSPRKAPRYPRAGRAGNASPTLGPRHMKSQRRRRHGALTADEVEEMVEAEARRWSHSEAYEGDPLCASRRSRYVSVINDNHLVSLMNFNEAKEN